MNFRTAFNVKDFSRTGDIVCEAPSMTQQHFKDECDINHIVSRYKVTGVLGDPNDVRQPLYADVSNIPDLMVAQNMVIEAQEKFMSLPSDVRKRFDNSPALMLEFLQNSNNREEAVKLGLIELSARDNGIHSSNVRLDVPRDMVVEKTVETIDK